MMRNIALKDVLFVVVFATIVFFGAFFLFTSLKQNTSNQKISVKSLEEKMSKKVNTRMQRLQTRDRIFKNKILSEVSGEFKDDLERGPRITDSKYKLNVFDHQNPNQQELRPLNASDKVQEMLSSEDAAKVEESNLLSQYKEQLIEKARKQGWAIEINDNLEVTSAKQL